MCIRDRVNTPKWTATAGGTFDVAEFDFGKLSWRVDWSYRSAMFKDVVNNPQCRQSGYSVVNSSLTLAEPEDKWQLSAGATNLTNKGFLAACYRSNSAGFVEGVYSRPREWFLRLVTTF